MILFTSTLHHNGRFRIRVSFDSGRAGGARVLRVDVSAAADSADFLFDEEELKPELRAQRSLNKQRVPEIARYLVQNPKGYTFSALTASIDAKVKFEPLGGEDSERNIGRLRVPMNARFVINDGQHRRAAIEAALHDNPDLGDETISVVFFLDVGLKRCQQMFADLNRFSVRTTPSLGLLYDHRDEDASVAKLVMERVPVFCGLTETERSTISNRSIKLFTLSGIHNATQALLLGLELKGVALRRRPSWQWSFGRRFRSTSPIGNWRGSGR